MSTLAGGSSGQSYDKGAPIIFTLPMGVAVGAGGVVYVTEANHHVYKVSPDGTISALAGASQDGYRDGQGAAARFFYPEGVATDASGTLYVADTFTKRLRKITPGGQVTTLAGSGKTGYADGLGRAASFTDLRGVAVSANGTIYMADEQRTRKITPGGQVSTLAGSGKVGHADGQGRAASFNRPQGLAIDAAGTLYVTDGNNNCLRKITPGGRVTTLAGSPRRGRANGLGPAARFDGPSGLVLAADGMLYVADANNNTIRRVTPAGLVSTYAGSGEADYADGPARTASFSYPRNLASGPDGTLYVLDGSHWLRKISPQGQVSTFAGSNACTQWVYADGRGRAARFQGPWGVAATADGTLYVADTDNNCIRKVTPQGVVSTFAGSCRGGYADGPAHAARFAGPAGIAVAANGTVYVSDGNNRIRKITPGGQVSTLAGSGKVGHADGPGHLASFKGVQGLAVAANGTVYVADYYNSCIRKITPAGIVSTFANDASVVDGPVPEAGLGGPTGVAVGPADTLFVTSNQSHCIYKITPRGQVLHFAGTGRDRTEDGPGAGAGFNGPRGLAVARNGTVYVAEDNSCLIRQITPGGEVSTLAGSDNAHADGPGEAASFAQPLGVAVDAQGVVYVADTQNNCIRAIR